MPLVSSYTPPALVVRLSMAVFVCLAAFSLSCGGYRFVSVANVSSGQLASRLGSKGGSVTDLTVSGSLDDSDVAFIEELAVTSDILSHIDLSNSSVRIPNHAFAGCSSLRSVSLPSSGMFVVERFTFSDCTLLSSVSLPPLCTSIEEFAFNGCSALKKIVLPPSLEKIGSFAFKNCTSLSQVSSQAEQPPLCRSNAFDGVPASCELVVPKGCASLYRNAVGWERFSAISEARNVGRTSRASWNDKNIKR